MPDTLGNVIETRNMDTGAQTSSTTYWPYGEVRTQTGTNPSPFGFCGVWGYYTQAGQPTYVRARYYRPNLGRWQTVDPLWPGESAFEYAAGSPSNLVDHSGLASCSVQIGPCFVPTAFGACVALLCSMNSAKEIIDVIKGAIKIGNEVGGHPSRKKIEGAVGLIVENQEMPNPDDCCEYVHAIAGRRIPPLNPESIIIGSAVYTLCMTLIGDPKKPIFWAMCAYTSKTRTECTNCCNQAYPKRASDKGQAKAWDFCFLKCHRFHDFEDVRRWH
jgi:RHS repeat-associated protein